MNGPRCPKCGTAIGAAACSTATVLCGTCELADLRAKLAEAEKERDEALRSAKDAIATMLATQKRVTDAEERERTYREALLDAQFSMGVNAREEGNDPKENANYMSVTKALELYDAAHVAKSSSKGDTAK